jgi:lysophospholipase L1-like esterase
MMRVRLLKNLVAICAMVWLSSCALAPQASERSVPTLGTPKLDNGLFQRRHEAFLQRGRDGLVGLLFLGDSITEGWGTRALALWQQKYTRYQPANFGIGGDRAEHVLWRIDNGELDHIQPRVVVLLIGTNNSASQSGAQIASLNRQIVALIQRKQPQCKVLLLGVFPRGPRKAPDGALDDGVKRMQVIRALNAELALMDDGKRVRYLDISSRFLVDGQIPASLMPDQLHPSLSGYQVWAEAMQPLLDEMLAAP